MDIGIDLGTTKVIIHQSEVGEILREPAVVAVDTRNDSMIAVGKEALAMLGRTPGYIRAEYPLADGVISDPVLTENMLKEFIRRACSSFLVKHRVIICVPSMITDVERRAVIETVDNAGGRQVYLIDEPIAAAIGAGIDITRANGSLVVDIGGGTLDVAVISLSGVVLSSSVRYAGNKIDEEIIRLLATKYKLAIGKKMAEKLKWEIGNVYAPGSARTSLAKGRNLLTGLPQQITLCELDIAEAFLPFREQLTDCVRRVLDRTPPELSSDIYEKGLVLTGGGSLLRGLPELLSQETNIRAAVAQNPIECVSLGTSRAFRYIDVLQTGFSSESTYKY